MSKLQFKKITPKDIKSKLDEYIIGQEKAKKVLSVAVYNHYKQIFNNIDNNTGIEIEKSNILLFGSTGCGKTLMVKTIAKMLDVPCYIQDCTKMTASGYVGSDVEDCLVGLLRECNYDLEKAKYGIVMLDEGDKIAKKEAGVSITRDVSGECVQQSLLKIVEGDVVGVPPMGGRKHPEQQLLYVDTKNILFILSGAFVGLENIVKSRLNKTSIGFTAQSKNDLSPEEIYDSVNANDLKSFGFIPEFIGRFPIITHVNQLTENEMVSIMKNSKNSIIKQYEALFSMDNIELKFTDSALHEIAKRAIELKTGARGLRSIISEMMIDITFEQSEKEKILVDKRFVNKYFNNEKKYNIAV